VSSRGPLPELRISFGRFAPTAAPRVGLDVVVDIVIDVDVVRGRFIVVGIWIDTLVSADDRHVSLLS
jgi:hypothetical protein